MFSQDLTSNYPSAVKFFTNAIEKNKLANSYVIIGRDIEGISSVILHLAKILNCEKNCFSTPCEKCINCNWLNKKEHPQALITITPDPKSKKEQIKIDNIRELLNALNNTSSYYRVVFFTNAAFQSLPQESSNLLLKTVEETPERTIFIFTSGSKYDVLPTIVSRSQTIYINNTGNINPPTKEGLTKDLYDCFTENMLEAMNKSSKILECLNENEIDLKDYLTKTASFNYERLKHTNLKQFITLYENLSTAYLKHKSFMQDRIVLQDLFLSLVVETSHTNSHY